MRITKERAPKGAALPALTPLQASEIVEGLGSKGLKSGHKDRLTATLGNKASSSIFVNKVIALRAFGLITTEGTQFNLTELGERIAFAKDNARLRAMQDVFLNQTTLSRIWTYYRGKELKLELLPDVLVNQNFVQEKSKKEWAKYFARAINEVGLVEEDSGRVFVANELAPEVDPHDVEIPQTMAETSLSSPSQASTQSSQLPRPAGVDMIDSFIKNFKGNVVRKTLSEGREFVLIIPEDLTKKDIAKIRLIMQSNQDGLDGYIIDDPSGMENDNV
jgi:hypothetical protein